MKCNYLVLTGNEFGIDINNNIDLSFRTLEDAELLYEKYLKEYLCATMFKLNSDLGILKLEKIKSDERF